MRAVFSAPALMVTLLLTLPPPCPALPGEIPELIPSPLTEAPEWVDASLVAPGGHLQVDRLDELGLSTLPETIERVRGLRERQGTEPGRCAAHIGGGWQWEEPKPNGSLEELTRHARAAVSGRVQEIAEGFYHGQVGSLIRLEVQKTLKPHVDVAPGDELLVFYPWAEIEVDGELLCAQNPREAVHPVPGTRMVVFVHRGIPSGPNPVIYPDDEEVIFQAGGGRLSMSRRLGPEHPTASLDEVERYVQSLASRPARPPEGAR